MDKIICVGKNYLEHAKELGDAVPDAPVLFLKPPSILRRAQSWGDTLKLATPANRGELHHECEIVLRVMGGVIVSVSLGLDMTLRTLQAQLKKNGHPWTIAKVFPDAAVMGPEIPLRDFRDYLTTPFEFSLNSQIKQTARGEEMMMKPQVLLEHIGACFPLCDGDLIFTGTPAGVGPVRAGDRATLSWGQRSYSIEWA
jgi:2-keto-4-pentenoate hydratase/2-oxohepta-3-ene-1,7-dioic acid hydratase in catechol pathway